MTWALFLSATDFHQGDERFSVHSRGKQCAFMTLGTGHNLAGVVGRWKQWGGGGHIFFSQEKGGFIKY